MEGHANPSYRLRSDNHWCVEVVADADSKLKEKRMELDGSCGNTSNSHHASGYSSINDITDAQLLIALSCVSDGRDMACCSCVSRQWHRTVKHLSKISFTTAVSDNVVSDVISRMPHLHSLSLPGKAAFAWSSDDICSQLLPWFLACPNLQELQVGHPDDISSLPAEAVVITPKLLLSFSACLHNLKSLRLFRGEERAFSYPITMPPFLYPSLQELVLPHFPIQSSHLSTFLQACPSLTSLSVSLTCNPITLSHPRLSTLRLHALRSSRPFVNLLLPALTSLEAYAVSDVTGIVSPDMTRLMLVLYGSTTLSLSPRPSKLHTLRVVSESSASVLSPRVMEAAVEMIHSSAASLASVHLLPQLPDGPTDSVPYHIDVSSENAERENRFTITLSSAWTSISALSSLCSLTLECFSSCHLPLEPFMLPNLTDVTVVIWDVKQLLEKRVETVREDGRKELHLRGLLQLLQWGAPKLKDVTLMCSDRWLHMRPVEYLNAVFEFQMLLPKVRLQFKASSGKWTGLLDVEGK